ncbi:MAG: YbjN domain-containing protein [Rothia sp. (in: high G+C Gram-positive bacteria)]|uniref:YbjN domain-containing protein n=1 Tax=Rothia sp. (in: high G+C Gram-positive bacteria) TaxID=1885016 RepID=UPI00270F0D7C|nr:YbjN domain-containing protein [Rothia sp. (in: high G+C Gram-positive bacteria)]
MGYFDSVQSAAQLLTPITNERMLAALDRLEVDYELGDDGTAVFHFERGYFYYTLSNAPARDLLSVRGSYRGTFPLEALPALNEFTNAWNQQNLFPKVFPYRVEEDGQGLVVLPVELSMVYAGGATDAQIDEHLRAAVQTSLEYFENLASAFGFGEEE